MVLDSDKNKVTFCKDAYDKGGIAYAHKDDARMETLEISDRLLAAIVKLTAEWYGEEPVAMRMRDTHDMPADDAKGDGHGKDIATFDVRMRHGRVIRYEVSMDTLACFAV